MRNVLKWIAIGLGVLIVLTLIVGPFVMHLGGRGPMMAGGRGFEGAGPQQMQPRTMPHRFGDNDGAGPSQRMPRMDGGYGRMGGFGMLGFMGMLVSGGLRLFGMLLVLGLVGAGIVFVVRSLSRPKVVSATAAPVQAVVLESTPVAPAAPAAAAPAEAAELSSCASCGRELQVGWAHCPHCGAKI